MNRVMKGLLSFTVGTVIGVLGLCAFANARYMDGFAGFLLYVVAAVAMSGGVWLCMRPFRRWFR